MTDESSKPIDQQEWERVLALDEEMRDMPRETRNVLQPVKLSGKDNMRFRCHPGISCFNACCQNVEIVLTPYDLYRLRHRMNMSAEDFLHTFAIPTTLAKGQLPVALIRMDAETGRCPFNRPEGCSVYSDRPVTCRYYPIGMALMRRQESQIGEDFYFLIKEDFCQGHKEAKDWTVQAWREDQGSDGYDKENRSWMELIIKRRSAGDMIQTSLSVSEMFYMASTNPEAMRRFLFDSSFLQRYQVDAATEEKIRHDDLALTDFALNWMKSVLFGDSFVPVRPEVFEDLKQRRSQARGAQPAPKEEP
ncbi:MAG: YkgJ family cysteine cluster protein [Magnetococcales bacterium]|nr:YkgJ family cysteine cluster protein [Magnetococcales bacterium]